MNYSKIAGLMLMIIIIQLTLFGCQGGGGSSSLTSDFLSYEENTGTPADISQTTPETVMLSSSISGYIYDYLAMTPVAGAKLKLDGFLTTYTDNQGYYEISNIYLESGSTPASKNLSISAPTYDGLEESITLNPGVSITASFRLTRKTGTVSGIVISNGNTVQNATVILGEYETVSNMNGYYTFTEVPVGVTILQLKIADVIRLSTQVEILETFQNLNINLDSNQGEIGVFGKIEGTITDSQTGALVPGIIAAVSGYPAAISGSDTSTSQQPEISLKGFYSINNIPTGIRTVTFVDPNGNYYDYTQNITIAEGSNQLNIKLTPKPSTQNETANLAGIIYGPDSELVGNITVRLRLYDASTGTYISYNCLSESDGWFSFVDIPQGTYILTATDSSTPKVYSDYYIQNLEIKNGTNYLMINMAVPTAP